MYYIDINKNKYLCLEDYYNGRNSGKIRIKNLLNGKRLIVLKEKKEIYSTENIQSLYLYPLNILDYLKYAYQKKTLMYNILNLENVDFEKLINNNIKNIEVVINKQNLKDIDKILELSKIMKSKNQYISYNMKTLDIPNELIKQISIYADYLKIKLDCFKNKYNYIQFLNKIRLIKENVNEETLIHIKGYLQIDQIVYYKKLKKDLKNIADIIQISKELIPSNCRDNPKVNKISQEEIRELEKKNRNFISVKDLTTLYYPRFELDDRNSHKCFVWYIKPYIYGDYILPCKVNKVMKNINDWKVKDISSKNSTDNIKKYGNQCTDCASIFENDILFEIFEFYAKGYDFLLEIDEK